ncbi:hypothetical protein F4780DRAFT_795501 [Xylariomycetidae sp. FL0641]|nr:hypothetical protein F4780DRAFT_795501 [Xylariomycetidae sp. FL0641]
MAESKPPEEVTAASDANNLIWNSCADLDDMRRIIVKEKALEDAIRHCKALRKSFEDAFLTAGGQNAGDAVFDRRLLEDWIKKLDAAVAGHDDFGVLVGVKGATGVGKTSTMNALLGHRALLPTDDAEASTAVPCHVAYNHDERPEFAFRAVVNFKNRDAVISQFDDFFESLEMRNELRAAIQNRKTKPNKQDNEALRDLNSSLKQTMQVIKALTNLPEKDIETLSTKTLLESYPDLETILESPKEIHHAEAKSFTHLIKPYLTSTAVSHSKSGKEFPAWPLIEEVRLFVKSDVLRNGVVLVDLPGVADATQSRSEVSKRYIQRLTATMVITRAVRAADDATVDELVTENEEVQEQMLNRLNKRQFSFVLTHTDQIDTDKETLAGDAAKNAELDKLRKEQKKLATRLKSKKKEYETQKSKVNKLSRATAAKTKKGVRKQTDRDADKARKGATAERTLQVEHMEAVSQEVSAIQAELDVIEGNIKFLFISARNSKLQQRFDRKFKEWQEETSTDTDADAKEAGTSVWPVAPLMFWNCVGKGGQISSGFPSKNYTGIPQLRRWVRIAAIQEREAHADSLLPVLLGLYNNVQTWSNREWIQNDLQFDRATIEDGLLPTILGEGRKRLDSYWPTLNKDIKKLNPLDNKKLNPAKNQCASTVSEKVENWYYVKPDDKTSNERTHWTTYQACIARSGGEYYSGKGEARRRIFWMESIATVFVETLVEEWRNALYKRIPALADEAGPVIDDLWDHWLDQLRNTISGAEPKLKDAVEKELPKMDAIKQQVKTQIKGVLNSIHKGASNTYPDVISSLQRQFLPTFKAAHAMKGNGSYEQRREFIEDFVSKPRHITRLFNVIFDEMKTQLKRNLGRLPKLFQDISEFAVNAMSTQFVIMLDTVAPPKVKVEEALQAKASLQRQVRVVLTKWDMQWFVDKAEQNLTIHLEDVAIPKGYVVEETPQDDAQDNSQKDSDQKKKKNNSNTHIKAEDDEGDDAENSGKSSDSDDSADGMDLDED